MRNEQDAAAPIRKGAQVIQRMGREVQVEPRRRLVGDDETRLVHKRAHKEHAASHAARKLMRIEALRLGTQAVINKELMRASPTFRRATRPKHLVAHTHERIEIGHALRNHAHAMAAERSERIPVLCHPVEPDSAIDLSVIWPLTHKGIGEDGLSRARCANDGEDLAHMHAQREIMQYLAANAPSPPERDRRIVHGKRDGQVLHLKQVVPTGMT